MANKSKILNRLKDNEPAKFAVYFILFFVSVAIGIGSTIKAVAMICLVAVLIAGLTKFSDLRNHFHLPMLILVAFLFVNGCSTLYAISGKFALDEFLKLLISFSLVIVALIGFKENTAHKFASVLEYSGALFGVISIDLLSTRVISNIILGFFKPFTTIYDYLEGVEAGTRMISLFKNPNAFAGCMGICVMISLGLVLASDGKKERTNHLVCLFITSLSFVLAFSMGAIAFIAVAFIVYLFLELRDRRPALIVLMVETLVLVLMAAVVISMTSFDSWDGIQPIPLVCILLGSAAIVLLDKLIGQPVTKALQKHSAIMPMIIGGILVVAAVFGVLAFNLTGKIALTSGETLRRSVYLEPGSYHISVDKTSPVEVMIESQNKIDTMMHTSSVLYSGELSEASFEVPDDSMVVFFNISAAEEVLIQYITCDGPEKADVPLEYKLLPDFIANRLQGLFANQNAIQRTVFFEDGIKIFLKSPLFGLGLGAYQNAIANVQTFFYATRYAHNHYIQTLTETGLIGLFIFLALIIISAITVLKELKNKEQSHPLAPALGAALCFMAGHALVEVDFSFFAFIPFAFGVFGLINVTCGHTISPKWLSNQVRKYTVTGCALFMVVFACLLTANIAAEQSVKDNPTFDRIEKAVKIDVFERNDYMLSYVKGAMEIDGYPEIQEKARHYAEILSKEHSNSIPIYLAEYYFENGEISKGFAMVEKYVRYVAARQDAWDEAFLVLIIYAEDTAEYKRGVEEIVNLMNEWNDNNLGKITLSDNARQFLDLLNVEY